MSYQPVRMVCPTRLAPSTTWRHIGVANLAVAEIAGIPSVPRLEKDLAVVEKGLGFFADCDGKDLSKVRRCLARSLNKLKFSVSPPEKSPGHTKDFPRIRFHIGFEPGSISSFDIGGIFRLLRGEDDSESLLLANDNTLEDGRALLVEVTHVIAAKEIIPLCSDALWLNPCTLLCRTDHLPKRWSEMIGGQFETHPEEMTVSVKARESAGGKTWASCPTTPGHARAMAKNKKTEGEPFRDCEVNIHGSHCHGAIETMRVIIGKLRSVRLPEAPPQTPPWTCTNGPLGRSANLVTLRGPFRSGWARAKRFARSVTNCRTAASG